MEIVVELQRKGEGRGMLVHGWAGAGGGGGGVP